MTSNSSEEDMFLDHVDCAQHLIIETLTENKFYYSKQKMESTRRCRTSYDQFLLMIEFMEAHGDISKVVPGFENRHKFLWEELTKLLNDSTRETNKPMENWKKVWTDFKYKTKRKAAFFTVDLHGGEPHAKPLTSLEERVLRLIRPSGSGSSQMEEADVAVPPPLPQQAEIPHPVIEICSSPDSEPIIREEPPASLSSTPSLPDRHQRRPRRAILVAVERIRQRLARNADARWQTLERLRHRLDEERNQTEAERAQIEAERARIETEYAQIEGECIRIEAERLQLEGERARMEAERAQIEGERIRIEAERVQIEAERAQIEAEYAQIEGECIRIEAERLQLEGERARIEAERAQIEGERTRIEAERVQIELRRVINEEKLTEAIITLNCSILTLITELRD